METLTFASSKEFLEWARRTVKAKDPHFDRVPLPEQTWTYGDGHKGKSGYGKRGKTLLANLGFFNSTGTGR
ncbi:hypothetical protein GGC47_004516 [Bosea sp. OAE752]|uniref:hypothetical protein n=1 Tax=Bosea sp. OAE752 TaxID=2663873 RepID=UPI003D20305C